jgi:hypothetical protein
MGEATMSDDSAVDAALRVIRADYYKSVRSYASGILTDMAAEGRYDSEELGERIDQTVDGSYWVIYTHAALRCILVSSNDGAWEDVGDERPTDEVRAYRALRADIVEELERTFGVDLNDPCPECDECGGHGELAENEDGSPHPCEACDGKGYSVPTGKVDE